MKIWKLELLHGVDVVTFHGCIPCVIVAYGENAQPILASKKGEILCAAGKWVQSQSY